MEVESKVQNEVMPVKAPKKIDYILIKDPALGGWELQRTFGKLVVEHPEKTRSRYEAKDMQDALSYIFEMRVVNEVEGELTMAEYNQKVKAIQQELQTAGGVQ